MEYNWAKNSKWPWPQSAEPEETTKGLIFLRMENSHLKWKWQSTTKITGSTPGNGQQISIPIDCHFALNSGMVLTATFLALIYMYIQKQILRWVKIFGFITFIRLLYLEITRNIFVTCQQDLPTSFQLVGY